ncbi:MAG TPA: sigma 54-interacting transcriptional regulator [Bdellovibrionota bacterium]|nr:sigma 54-interacting transcriptional regulator [Bdellovibrionota bacterium]
MSLAKEEVVEEKLGTEGPLHDEETEKIDWDRVAQLRVTRKIMDAMSNLEVSAVYLTRANRRKDARKKYLGHGSRKMLSEAETPFVLKQLKPYCAFIQKNAEGLSRCREDCLKVVEDAINKGDVVTKECHAGLIEMAVPVRLHDRVVGIFRCGEFASGKPDSLMQAKLEEKVAPLQLQSEDVQDHMKKLPYFPSEKIAVVNNLMGMLSQEISDYIQETNKDEKATSEMDQFNYRGLITKNPIILDIIRQIKLIGASESSVIIYGESGTGKELVSKLIHEHSPRAGKSMVTINCAALTDTILEAELFGYKKGAFTGAVADKKGLFEVADTGTIFLDEVGEMSLALQVKILRLIQEGTFMRVGDTEMRQVDVRIISATHRDLRKLIELAKFREDLYYRLAVVELTLPPLRDRPDDTALLIHQFLSEFQQKTGKEGITLSSEVMQVFQEYYWPGNVRELRNEIERLVALRSSHSLIKAKDLSKKFFYETYPEGIKAGDEDEEGFIKKMVDDFERNMLSKYLRKHHWNKTKVARLCGITRQGLNKKIMKYRLDRRRI